MRVKGFFNKYVIYLFFLCAVIRFDETLNINYLCKPQMAKSLFQLEFLLLKLSCLLPKE